MKHIFFIFFVIILGIVAFNSCKPTDEDIANSELILGHWEAIDSQNNALKDIPKYTFDTANNGSSSFGGETNNFKWEIRRSQLKIYYEKAPSYYIAYDKYNSRSLMRISEISTDILSVTQFFADGYQSKLKFRRYYPEED